MSSNRSAKSVSSVVSDSPAFLPLAGNKDMALVQARVLAAKTKIENIAFEAIGIKKVSQNILIPRIVEACPDLTPATVAIILRGDAPPAKEGSKPRGRKRMTEEEKAMAKARRDRANALLAAEEAKEATA